MAGINEIVVTVSFIRQVKGGNIIGSASGFFYGRGDKLLLVTNQHVMRNDAEGIIPDVLRLRLHKDPSNVTLNDDFDVPLYSTNQPLWKIHPQHRDADIALILLDKDSIQKDFFVKAWSASAFLPSNYSLNPGEDVFIMGYPLSFHDFHHNLPIFRNAMVASAYRVPFQNKPLFLTDANLHPGTSGSPVITKPKSTWVDDQGNTNFLTGTPYYLVGVHSGTIAPSVTGGVPVGLGAAWYAELIEDIASLF